jgi:hypothetical protein
LKDARAQTGSSDREGHPSATRGDPHPATGDAMAGTSPSIIDEIRRLAPRTRAAMAEALLPGEQPHVVIRGSGDSAIVGTGERIIVIKSGVRAGAPLGAKAKAFEFESVIGVRLDMDATSCVVAVDAPVKIASCRVYWADSRDNAWKARNAMPVDPPFSAAAAGVSALRGLIEAYRDRHPRPGPRMPAPRQRDAAVVQAVPSGETPAEERATLSALPGRGGDRCPHCRAELRAGWRYCPGCGAPSESASAR